MELNTTQHQSTSSREEERRAQDFRRVDVLMTYTIRQNRHLQQRVCSKTCQYCASHSESGLAVSMIDHTHKNEIIATPAPTLCTLRELYSSLLTIISTSHNKLGEIGTRDWMIVNRAGLNGSTVNETFSCSSTSLHSICFTVHLDALLKLFTGTNSDFTSHTSCAHSRALRILH